MFSLFQSSQYFLIVSWVVHQTESASSIVTTLERYQTSTTQRDNIYLINIIDKIARSRITTSSSKLIQIKYIHIKYFIYIIESYDIIKLHDMKKKIWV